MYKARALDADARAVLHEARNPPILLHRRLSTKPAPRPLSSSGGTLTYVSRDPRDTLAPRWWGKPAAVTWSAGAALVGGGPAARRPYDQTRRHSELISCQCRIVRKWRGILALLAPRRTFKSTAAGRRTDDLRGRPSVKKAKGKPPLPSRVGFSRTTSPPSSPVRRSKRLPSSLSLSPLSSWFSRENKRTSRSWTLDNHESRDDLRVAPKHLSTHNTTLIY